MPAAPANECMPQSVVSKILLRLMQAATAISVPRGLPRLGWLGRHWIVGSGVRSISYRGRFNVCCDTSFYPSVMFAYGIQNRYIDRLIGMVIRPHDVVFDVGANVGMISLLACSSPNVRGTITAHCFEPDPNALAWLHLNRAQNSFNMKVNECGVGASRGQSTLSISTRLGSSSFVPEPTDGTIRAAAAGQKTIDIVALDDYSIANKAVPSLIKIDVEGFETEVLRGATRIMQQFKPIFIVEINPVQLTAAGSSAEELADTFRSFGYRMFHSRKPNTPSTKDRLHWRGLPEAYATDVPNRKIIDVIVIHDDLRTPS